MELTIRPRRLRSNATLRSLIRENAVSAADLILPLFASDKVAVRQPVASMPGVAQMAPDEIERTAVGAWEDGVRALLLFGIPSCKDGAATGAYSDDGVVQRALRKIKAVCPDMVTITDVCLCEYMSHGHCGITNFTDGHAHVENDASVELLVRTAISHAAAGADIVAPSDMMDGRVGAIRAGLDGQGFQDIPILSYAAKYASAFYGPFRDAAESAPVAGDRRTYQMDPANALEALREVELDVQEGADMVMVKPGGAYLDVVWRVKEAFGLPTAVYQVSGEYSMVKAAAAAGWLDERAVVMEQMLGFKRAGADLIVTYWAREVARWLGAV
jgi:porphobilinogen synthase